MTRQLDEILERVRSVQPGAAEWSAIEARVTASMTSASSPASPPAAGRKPPGVSTAAAAKGSVWGAWVAGSVATGAVATGLLFAYRSEPSALQRQATAPEPLAPQAAEFSTRLNSYPLEEPTAESWSTRSTPRVRSSQGAPLARSPAVSSSVPEPVAQTMTAPEQTASAESDVEHDRRQLAAVDAALRANEPRRALQLLSRFQPRVLQVYTRALRAIALCNVGAHAAGAEVGRSVLPGVSNGGLQRRIRHACEL